MRDSAKVLVALLLPLLTAFTISSGNCPNRQATTTAAPSLDCSDPKTTCADGSPCDFLCTYTPPATKCGTEEVVGKCCQNHNERAYIQGFSCQGPGTHKCKPGAKVFFGQGVTVYTTATCDEAGDCPDWVDPDAEEGDKK